MQKNKKLVLLCLKAVCVYDVSQHTNFWGVSLCCHAWAIVDFPIPCLP